MASRSTRNLQDFYKKSTRSTRRERVKVFFFSSSDFYEERFQLYGVKRIV